MCLQEISTWKESSVILSNILCIIIIITFVIPESGVDNCILNSSVYIERKSIILRWELGCDCRTDIITNEITVTYQYLLVIVLIGAKYLLTVLNMKCPFNLRPIYY